MENSSNKKPFLVLISGAPGSGKSTLARNLAEVVQFMYVDLDVLLQNFWLQNTNNKNYDREKVGVPRAWQIVENLLSEYKVGLIVDAAPTDVEISSKLTQSSHIIHLHCHADNVNERFYKREIGPNGEEPDWLGPQMKELEKNLSGSSELPELGFPIIEVDTNNNYEPSLKTLIEAMQIPDGYKLWNKFT